MAGRWCGSAPQVAVLSPNVHVSRSSEKGKGGQKCGYLHTWNFVAILDQSISVDGVIVCHCGNSLPAWKTVAPYRMWCRCFGTQHVNALEDIRTGVFSFEGNLVWWLYTYM